MMKVFGGVLIGVFVGAFAVEVFRRLRPEILASVGNKARDSADAIFSAFRNGYDRPAAE
jgi:hypothetical protein